MKMPCKDCKERHLECHSNCDKYTEAKKELSKLKKLKESKRRKDMGNSTRSFSDLQEKHIAELTGGKITSNSGGTKFGGGDILTDSFLIEAKTSMSEKQSFSIKKEWLKKSKEQAFEQGKDYSALAFQFEPAGENHYIISEELFLELLQKMEEN